MRNTAKRCWRLSTGPSTRSSDAASPANPPWVDALTRWLPVVVWAAFISWFSTDAPGLLIDTVKRAEDGDALIIRLYEAHGGRGTARLRVGVPFAEAWFTNLLEDRLAPADVDGEEVVIPFRPFEIVTVALGQR